MNKTLTTILTVFAILVLAGAIFFAGSLYARMSIFGPSVMLGRTWNNGNTYRPSMMGGGMMRGYQRNMMGGYGYNNAKVTPLTIDQAKAAAEKYLANINNADLQIAEIMVFDNNAYVVVKETSTGKGAFELLVDPVSQIAYPEHGPNMMWNLKYGGLNHQNMTLARSAGMGSYSGMMANGGMMMNGWNSITPSDLSTTEMTVTSQQAVEYAQKYLDRNLSGATAATDLIQFYGYYTIDFEKDGKVAGMLSVNGYNGQVFLHTWHGKFIEETELQ